MSQIKVELQNTMGNDREIAESAWTSSINSSKKKTKSDQDVANLIKFLAEHKHSTPFESVAFRFWIKMPIATDRQFITHRIQSTSGMSGRYRTMPNEFLEIPNDVSNILNKVSPYYILKYNELCKQTNQFYLNAVEDLKVFEKNKNITNIELKRAREFLRGVLPQHNLTERISIMNLRAFSNFIKLRLSEHAQPEIREVAKQMLECVKESQVCPVAIEELEKIGWII